MPPDAASSTQNRPSVVVSTPAGGYTSIIHARSHRFSADEPASVGGGDTGPTPYELLLGAIGSCKCITVTMYARRKGWPLEDALCALRHTHDHARDCENCDSEDARLETVEAEMQFVGDLTDDQRQRLLEIADRCPVHRTLSSGLRIKSTLVTPDR